MPGKWINIAQKTLLKHVHVCAYKKERGWGSEDRVGEGRLLIGRIQWKMEAVGLGVSENPRLSIQHKFMRRLMSYHSCSFEGRTLEEVNCIVLKC